MKPRLFRIPSTAMLSAVLAVRVTGISLAAAGGLGRTVLPPPGVSLVAHPGAVMGAFAIHRLCVSLGVTFCADIRARKSRSLVFLVGALLACRQAGATLFRPVTGKAVQRTRVRFRVRFWARFFETKVSSVTHVTQPGALLAHPAAVMGRSP